MVWISAQRYQNEVSLPGPRCTLHICINVLRQTQSSHVPSQTPKYHTPKTSQKTLEYEYAFWRLSGLSGSFQCVTIPESWAARNDECQRAPRRRPPASKNFGKQRLIKCYEMLMKLEISFFQNPEISEEKTTCFVFSLFRALEKLQVQEQDSIFGKFAAAVSCGASRLPLHTFREMVLRTLCLKRGDEQELYTFFPLNNYRLTIINTVIIYTL